MNTRPTAVTATTTTAARNEAPDDATARRSWFRTPPPRCPSVRCSTSSTLVRVVAKDKAQTLALRTALRTRAPGRMHSASSHANAMEAPRLHRLLFAIAAQRSRGRPRFRLVLVADDAPDPAEEDRESQHDQRGGDEPRSESHHQPSPKRHPDPPRFDAFYGGSAPGSRGDITRKGDSSPFQQAFASAGGGPAQLTQRFP